LAWDLAPLLDLFLVGDEVLGLVPDLVAVPFTRPLDDVLAATALSALESALGFTVLVLAMVIPPVATERADRTLKQCGNYTPLSI
jgi:hypothetical protein